MHKVLGLFLLLFLTALNTSAADTRPNILFCLADDWSWPHAGVYGDKVVKTPNFDRVAREGVLFHYCFSAASSCTPSRAAILTGQYPHRLKQGGNLWGFLPKEFPTYVELLAAAGYQVGLNGKGWGPGDFKSGGYTQNPAGTGYRDFAQFLQKTPDEKPFCYWMGSNHPHRPYTKGEGALAGLKAADVIVPPMWPDNPEVRNDILDYYVEVNKFDDQLGTVLELLEKSGRLQNTIVVVSGDNGWPFPRGKANLYDAGTRQPLAVRWPAKIKGGREANEFVNLADLAPTFLEAAGIQSTATMTGKSILGVLLEKKRADLRDTVFLERERHANVRKGDLSYPSRAIRTREYLYIRNLRAERWPAGDPEKYVAVGPFGDCDDGPTKQFLLAHRDNPLFELCFGLRPAEELYDLKNDPHQIHNLAGLPKYKSVQKSLRTRLDRWMQETGDPRVDKKNDVWDRYPYFGDQPRKP